MRRYIFIFLMAVVFFMPSISNATMFIYTGAGTGRGSDGIIRSISGEMIISDQIIDEGSGFPISKFHFEVEGFFEYSGENGSINHISILNPDGSIYPGAYDLATGGFYEGEYWQTEAMALFLDENLDYYGIYSSAYFPHHLPPYIQIVSDFYRDTNILPIKQFGVWENDNFYLARNPVPEPATIILVGLGIAGLLFRQRRIHINHI